MAFHSAQGPQLGLPQMIQSRPQFGYIGALLVWLFAYVQYAGFNVFNTILAGQAGDTTIHLGEKAGIVIATILAVVVALIGYDLIHRVEQGLTYTFILIFGVFTIGAIATLGLPAGALSLSGFKLHAVPHAVRRDRGLPDLLGDLRVGLLALSAAGRDRAQDVPVDLLGLGAGRHLADGAGRAAGRVGGRELRHRAVDLRRRQRHLRRLRHGRAAVRRAGSDLGHRAEPVRRLADADRRDRLVQAGAPDDRRAHV